MRPLARQRRGVVIGKYTYYMSFQAPRISIDLIQRGKKQII